MKDINFYIKNLNVLYEDNHIIVVEKYENILSQKDKTDDFSMIEIIKGYLKEKYNKPGNVYLGLVHRLDRRVGGVMVFAKTSKAASRLSLAMQEGMFEKRYIALVFGDVDKDGSINIKMDKTKDNMAVVTETGKEAKLDYKVITHSKECSLVDVLLLTGRYNQIRLSFAHIGHPIVNDYKYSSMYKVSSSPIGLYAYFLSFPHPITKEKMTYKIDKELTK